MPTIEITQTPVTHTDVLSIPEAHLGSYLLHCAKHGKNALQYATWLYLGGAND